MIFKQETIKSWFSGVGTSVNNEIVQPFQNANSVISKYNLAIQHNSLTQQGWEKLLAQSDDSLKAYLTSIKGSTASIAGYNISLQGSITGFTKVSNAIKEYNALGAVGLKEQQTFATAVDTTNSKLGAYLIGLNGSTAGLRGYGVSLVASAAKTIGLTVATTALNAAMAMDISVIVTGLISVFTAWINKSEEITEKAQEAADKINSIRESLKTNTETVENAKRRYAELAQEVENLGKITQSQGTLSNEEYEEFLDLSNQLAGIFPSLTKNYDENGNAILNLSGDVNTIVSSLDDLIRKEKELANQKIMEEFPDVFKGYTQDVSDAELKVKSAQTEFDKINNAYQQLSNGSTAQAFDLQGNGWFTNENGEKVTLLMGEYIANLEALGLEYEKTQLKVKNQFGGDTITGYLVEATGDIDTAFTSKLETARENLQYAQQQLEGEKSSIDSYLNTWLQGEFSYVQIEDSGLQTAIQDMLFNFDFSNIPENKRGDWNYVSEYLRRNILFEINKVQDDPVISKAISEVFSNTELTPDEKANYLQQIQDYFGEDSSIVISLKPQIDETETLQKQYDKAIEDTKAKFDGYDPTAFFKENSINTQEEIDKWLKIAQAANSAVEAEEKYLQGSTPNTGVFTDIFSLEDSEGTLTTLGKISQSIDKIQNAYKTLSSAIDEYNENGYLSIDTIQSITELGSGYLDYLIDEEGNLRLDQEALQELTVARLRDMQAQMQQELISQIESIKNETDATNFAAQAYREKAESINMVTKAMLQNKVASLNISDTAKDEVLSAANKTLTQINTMFDNAVSGVYANPADVIGGSSSSSSSSSSEIDFMEYRLTEIENLANEVQNAIDEAAHTADKNALIDQMERINSTKADTLAQTVKYYTQKANEYLQEIPESLRAAAKNGAIAVSEFAGDENVAVAEAIQNFRDMQGSIADATTRLSELRQELIELEKTKFDNLVNAFGDLTSIITNNTSVIQAQISYLEDAGERVGSGYYTALIEQSRLYLEQLQKERNALSDQLSSAMSKGVKYGSDEWYDMYSQIQNIDEQIISLTSDIENYGDSLRALDWSIFDDTVDAAGRLTEQMDNIIDLLDTDKASGDYNGYSADAVTAIGMYMEQMESAKYLISESNSEIAKLEKSYASGKISVGEYTERLEALQDTLWGNISAYNEAEHSILDLAEARINEAVEAINTETEAEKNRIQALKDELQAEKDLEDYKRSLEEKQADADSIQAQINARKGSTDAATIAEREKLEAQLAEKLKEIQQMQQDQAYEDTIEDLDRQEEAYEESQQKRIDALEKQLEDEQALLLTAMNTALLNASTVTSQLTGITQTYGVQIDSNITSPWKNASAYVKTFNQDGKISLDNMNTNVNNFSSNFTTQLGGIKTDFTDLQKKANTASTNISKSIGAIDTTKLSTMVSTLGKKIDTSGITDSIDTVKGKVDNLNTSLSNVLNKYESLATAQIKTPETTNSHLYAVQGTYNGNQVYYKTYTNKTEADKAAAQVRKIPELKSAQISVIQVYKNGGEIARYANGGELDNLAQSIGEDHISTIAWRDGERIITPEQNKAFLKLADLGSSMMQQGIMDNLTKLASMSFPSGFTKSVTSPTLNIENLLNVQGNVTKDSLPQLQSMLDKTKTEIFNEFGRMLLNKNTRRPR